MDLGYAVGEFEPYALFGYRNDLDSDDGASAGGLPGGVQTTVNDDDEWRGGLGLRYFGASGITGSLEWLRTLGLEKFDEDAFTMTLRVPF